MGTVSGKSVSPKRIEIGWFLVSILRHPQKLDRAIKHTTVSVAGGNCLQGDSDTEGERLLRFLSHVLKGGPIQTTGQLGASIDFARPSRIKKRVGGRGTSRERLLVYAALPSRMIPLNVRSYRENGSEVVPRAFFFSFSFFSIEKKKKGNRR